MDTEGLVAASTWELANHAIATDIQICAIPKLEFV